MTAKYNKHGIRILDPETNHMAPTCNESKHVWARDNTRQEFRTTEGDSWDYENWITTTHIPVVCTICGFKSTNKHVGH